jgi:hypothetical protein
MSSHTYVADEARVYPTLGITAEKGESYELADGAPEDGRWDELEPVKPAPSPAPTPPAAPAPAPAPTAAPAPPVA